MLMLKNDMMLHFYKVSVNILEEVRQVHSAMSLLTKSFIQLRYVWYGMKTRMFFSFSDHGLNAESNLTIKSMDF